MIETDRCKQRIYVAQRLPRERLLQRPAKKNSGCSLEQTILKYVVSEFLKADFRGRRSSP